MGRPQRPPSPPLPCRGIATVEFAVALPVLLMLLLGIVEFGRAFYHYTTLTKLVRDGARYVAAYAVPNTRQLIELTPEVVGTARNLVVSGTPAGGAPLLDGLSAAGVRIEQRGAEHVAVTASYGYTPLIGRLPLFQHGGVLDMSRTMTVSVVMRAL